MLGIVSRHGIRPLRRGAAGLGGGALLAREAQLEGDLVGAFLAQARRMDAECVYLTTDADGNDAVNAFYRDVGFKPTRRFLQRKGRWMNEYVIDGMEAGDTCETHL